MATSAEILNLLRLLDDVGMDIGFLWGFIQDETRGGGQLPRILDERDIKEAEKVRKLTSDIVKAKQQPVRELSDETIQQLVGIIGDKYLDEHFTLFELQGIPGVVARWKKLRAVPVLLVPEEKVTAYMRQATTCYLYGLPSAAAALCRTVLEFALKEKLGALGGTSKPLDLEALINFFARNTKILSTNQLATKAHDIRVVGNDAIHKSACTESQALETIEKMGEILSHIYGRSGSRAR